MEKFICKNPKGLRFSDKGKDFSLKNGEVFHSEKTPYMVYLLKNKFIAPAPAENTETAAPVNEQAAADVPQDAAWQPEPAAPVFTPEPEPVSEPAPEPVNEQAAADVPQDAAWQPEPAAPVFTPEPEPVSEPAPEPVNEPAAENEAPAKPKKSKKNN